jgi:hypothetical protein
MDIGIYGLVLRLGLVNLILRVVILKMDRTGYGFIVRAINIGLL